MPKSYRTKATRKQRKVAKILVENGGMAISRAMRLAGYSPATAKNPEKLMEARGFLELLDEVMPDKDLLQLHRDGLNATLVKTATDHGSITDEKEYADYPTRHKYLETAYHIKGYLNPPNSDKVGDVNIQLTLYGDTGQAKIKAISGKVSRQEPRTQVQMESGMDKGQSGEV